MKHHTRRNFVKGATVAAGSLFGAGSLLAAAASGKSAPVSGSEEQHSAKVFIIQPDWVLGCKDDKLKILHNHEVVVGEDKILEVRPTTSGRDQRIIATGQLLLPGFISGHTHSCGGTVGRGFIEEVPYAAIQGEMYTPRKRSLLVVQKMVDILSDEDLDDLTAVNLAEMLRTGCTTQVEMSASFKQLQSYVRVATRFGVRGFPGAHVPGIDRVLPIWARKDNQALLDSEQDTLAEIAKNFAFSKTINGSAEGRIRPRICLAHTSVHTRATFAAAISAARELGNGLHIHMQNEWRERDAATLRAYWGKREVAVLQEVGMLNESLFGAHLLGVDVKNELPILARAKRFTFAHCPAGAGAGVLPSSQPYPEALAAGVNTSIGLDTHSNDYLENIKLAVMQGRSRAQLFAKTSPVPLTEPTMWHGIESATLAGARGLERKDLGRIQAGAKADLCTVAVNGLLVGSGTPALEPLNNLLYANGLAVRNVMTDGVWQVRDGKLLVGDEDELVARGGAAVKKVWAKLNEQGFFGPDVTV